MTQGTQKLQCLLVKCKLENVCKLACIRIRTENVECNGCGRAVHLFLAPFVHLEQLSHPLLFLRQRIMIGSTYPDKLTVHELKSGTTQKTLNTITRSGQDTKAGQA